MRQIAVPVKLLALLCALVGVFLAASPWFSVALVALALAFLLAQRNWRLAWAGGAFYLLLSLLLYLIRFQGLRMLVLSEFYVLMFWNLTPVFLLAWDLLTTPVGEISAFMSRIRLPAAVILGTLVMFRFFPTIKTELGALALSLRNRGLTRARRVLLHPLLTCEFVLVPLLLRCLQLADQLAVSAVARGAEAGGPRGSYYARPPSARDGLWTAAWLAACVAILVLGAARVM